jgi:hypothetical protein
MTLQHDLLIQLPSTISDDIKYMMAREGITKPAIDLLKSKNENAQKFGAYMLHCVSYNSGTVTCLMMHFPSCNDTFCLTSFWRVQIKHDR